MGPASHLSNEMQRALTSSVAPVEAESPGRSSPGLFVFLASFVMCSSPDQG